jgi:hypothetical protein
MCAFKRSGRSTLSRNAALTTSRPSCRPTKCGVLSSLAATQILEPVAIAQRDRNAVAEGVEQVVLSIAALVADAKALDLVEQVVS